MSFTIHNPILASDFTTIKNRVNTEARSRRPILQIMQSKQLM